ncbi:hypothetical protein [Devosia sp. SL43]|uniref:hypothetical protein n=1 Tax=Devosia sp. SL43 TaxID=2806348 RepID=UPI001F1BAE07|nr:hypothetical protein [Devosia sp. SL43]UJW85188.1 hypothetical protein IM737_17560 [Devosia sp. SL43]
MPLSKAAARRRKVIALTLSVSFVAAPQVNAFQDVVEGTRYFFECLGLMVGDPNEHAVECLPNRVVSSGPLVTQSGGAGGPDIVAPPPPVVIPPPAPPPVPVDPCVCGCPT